MSGLLKNLLFALGLAVILWIGYVVFLKDDGTTAPTVTDGALSSDAVRDTQELIAQFNHLRTIDFDETLFTSSKFRSLQDFRKDLESEPVGRANPFIPAL